MYTLLRSAMGADYNQTVKALAEAEAYPGPSLIIAYAPCINHGIKKGMSKAQTEEEAGCRVLVTGISFRFNPAAEDRSSLWIPRLRQEIYQEFLKGEVRYNSLKMSRIRRELRSCLRRMLSAIKKDMNI